MDVGVAYVMYPLMVAVLALLAGSYFVAGHRLLERVSEYVAWVKDLEEVMGSQIERLEEDFGKSVDAFFDVPREKMRKGVDYVEGRREYVLRAVTMELLVVVCGIVVLLVLLAAVGSTYWEYSVWVAWGVFLFEVSFLVYILWNVLKASASGFEEIEMMKKGIERTVRDLEEEFAERSE